MSKPLKHFRFAWLALAAAPLLLAANAPARAETITLRAVLVGGEEVPPNASGGSGTLDATFNTDTRKLTWTVIYSGLSGPATAAHFHGPAPRGRNAPPEVPVPVSASPMKGSATLTESQATDLIDGDVYFNIHTAKHPGGEIRGQVERAK